jgi:hypothetical protein
MKYSNNRFYRDMYAQEVNKVIMNLEETQIKPKRNLWKMFLNLIKKIKLVLKKSK